jgi:hypothetical protein
MRDPAGHELLEIGREPPALAHGLLRQETLRARRIPGDEPADREGPPVRGHGGTVELDRALDRRGRAEHEPALEG